MKTKKILKWVAILVVIILTIGLIWSCGNTDPVVKDNNQNSEVETLVDAEDMLPQLGDDEAEENDEAVDAENEDKIEVTAKSSGYSNHKTNYSSSSDSAYMKKPEANAEKYGEANKAAVEEAEKAAEDKEAAEEAQKEAAENEIEVVLPPTDDSSDEVTSDDATGQPSEDDTTSNESSDSDKVVVGDDGSLEVEDSTDETPEVEDMGEIEFSLDEEVTEETTEEVVEDEASEDTSNATPDDREVIDLGVIPFE